MIEIDIERMKQALSEDSIIIPEGLLLEEMRGFILSHAKPLTRCAAARDGDCYHKQCPQLRDNEPQASGRHCPIDNWEYNDD